MNISIEDKALLIIKAWHNIVHKNNNKTEGLIITKDWDPNTLTIHHKNKHIHFGPINNNNNKDEEGFNILIDELYNYYCIDKTS